MRLFLFAIGGTGSRVLKSLVMQFASGMVPHGADGKPVEVTVVPIILDPHVGNASVQNVNHLLADYKDIRKSLYPDGRVATGGFFAVKIETLKDTLTGSDTKLDIPQGFIFDMPDVARNEFRNFLCMQDMNLEDKLFTKMLFSQDELDTRMSEGFYGSPNTGTVALRVFKESDSFKALERQYEKDDRMFFMGSIFGGTGASGLPLLVSDIRQNTEKESFAQSPMGALLVMPYFSIERDDGSKMTQADHVIKTQTALHYYIDNLNPYLNSIYYVADEVTPTSFRNDPGPGGQKGNRDHFVEFIGGLAIGKFIGSSWKKDEISKMNDSFDPPRREAGVCAAWDFSLLKNDNRGEQTRITFEDIDKATRSDIMVPMMKFHILDRYLRYQYEGNLRQSYAKDLLDSSTLSSELKSFMEEYCHWLQNMKSHGTGHNMDFFSDVEHHKHDDFSEMFNEVDRQKGLFSRKDLKANTIVEALNKARKKGIDKPYESQQGKLLAMANEALSKLVPEVFKLNN